VACALAVTRALVRDTRQMTTALPTRLGALLALGLAAASTPLGAHEIPARAVVTIHVVRTADTLRLWVRAPLDGMRDVTFPERADGTLDLRRLGPVLHESATLWIAPGLGFRGRSGARREPRVVDARVAVPTDRSFEALDALTRHFAAPPLDSAPGLRVQGAWLDVALVLAVPQDERLTVEPAFARLGVQTTTQWRFHDTEGATRTLSYDGDPGVIPLRPRAWDAARRFVPEGMHHILGGLDHLLFLLLLVLGERRRRPLIGTVTAFTAAHALTIGATAIGFVPSAAWFAPLVETAIAGSVLWLALAQIVRDPTRSTHGWAVAFGFGLVHGFGFAMALGERLQFAGAHRVSALAAFNVGIELGQLAVVLGLVPVLAWLLRRAGTRARLTTIILAALIADVAWHWVLARGETLVTALRAASAPAWDALTLLTLTRGALVVAVALALALLLRHLLPRLRLT
jgi:hypothetical protein